MSNDIFPGAALRQLVEWGYPRGSLRPIPPADKAFSVVHITGNSRLPSAENEVSWRINDQALQNSATFFVNRTGSIVQALGDPLHMDPWANGDVNRPDMSNPRIAALVRDGVNANERTIVAIENVGYEPGHPITDAQVASDAAIIAYYHGKAGVPVNRETVIGHYQLNSVSRPNCPGVDKSVIDRIVAAANPTLPDTSTEEPMPKIIERVLGSNARFKSETPIRREPKFGAPAAFTAMAGATVQPFAKVEGDAYKVSADVTSNEWLAYVDDLEQIDYFPASLGTLEPISTGGVPQADHDALKVKVAAGLKAARQAVNALK